MPKKTTEIIIRSGNDYVIGVKKNQKNLYEQIERTMMDKELINSCNIQIDNNKGRGEIRNVQVSNCLDGISNEWIGLNQIIKVHRVVKEKGKQREETAYYFSSLNASALLYQQGIREHWSIENSLHGVKDGTFQEDASKIRTNNAPQNISTLRNIAINMFRNNKYENMAQAQRLISNDIPTMIRLFS